MQTVNRQIITIDLKKPSLIQLPQFIQGDTNILEIIIKEDGVDADLNNIGRIVASYRRPDGEEFSRLLTSTDNIVVYKLGVEENEVKGYGEVDVKFFSSDNLERISTKRFKVSLAESIGTGTIYENNGELTLLQELFVEVESIKQSAENEDARIENESQRQDAEAERNTKEIERQLAETSRIEAESTRLTSEQTRETNEVIRQQQEAARQNNTAQIISEAQQAILNTEIATQYATESGEYAVGKGNEAQALGLYAKQQGDRAQQIVDENKTIWLKPVATFAAIATTYPNPVFGSKVITMDDQKEYRFTTIWEWTGIYSSNGVTALQAQLADANRQTQNLQHGTSIFASALNSPVEFEVQGRTLISLGNSNLEGNKNYVLSAKNFKIRAEGREGTLINGVAKFTKSASLITKADYTGKVSGSVAENPHVYKFKQDSTTLLAPNGAWLEVGSGNIPKLQSLGDTPLYNVPSIVGNPNYAQMLYSFNIIEQIERKLGRIPSDTVAGKVQWIKDNVNKLIANWHGWGSSVGGNKANFRSWSGSAWALTDLNNHSNGTVTKLIAQTGLINQIQSDGFVHFLAYAEPSDGVTASQLNTDFIELEIELKSTAVLDTRPIITRVATFEGKVSGSTVENPHIVRRTQGNSSLTTLSNPNINAQMVEMDNGQILATSKLDNSSISTPTPINGAIAQHQFSLNLIEEIERNIGRIPRVTLSEKRQWCIDNVLEIIGDWWGFGSSVGGNKANFSMWSHNTKSWIPPVTHLYNTVAKTSPWSSKSLMNYVDDSGFVHFLAYAEPSDGVVASTINTDYFEFKFEFKQGATLHDPVLPLYEVDTADYANILVSWDENAVMSRYPRVQGVQHLQNLAVIAEGENIHKSFYEGYTPLATTESNISIISPYEMKIKSGGFVYVILDVIPNQNYMFISENTSIHTAVYDEARTITISAYSPSNRVFNTGNRSKIAVVYYAHSASEGTIKNPMLTLGSTPKPFVPRNPSALFTQTKLGQIGTVKDSLFKQDGQWQLVERVKKDVVLDGSLAWVFHSDYAGFKRLELNNSGINGEYVSGSLSKYNGETIRLQTGTGQTLNNSAYVWGGGIRIFAPDVDTGFGETYNPIQTEMQAYFNGWQAKTVDANGKPTAWRSLGNGTDAPIQTLAYVSTNRAPNFTPYKLSYVLAAPQTQNVSHLVEGDIVVSGPTQVEVTSGVVVREKATVVLNGGYALINDSAYNNKLKNKAAKIYDVYKGSQKDTVWTKINTVAHGTERVYTLQANYDATQDYYVTYLVLDRHLHTVNATEIKASYSGSLKDTVDMNNEKLSDVATQQSILANQMYRVLVAAKGAGWNV
jgi:hypothetical protein